MVLVGLLAVLLLGILLGFPVILAIGGAAIAGVLADPDIVLPIFAIKTFATLDSFSLLAMPYFILAGGLMSHGGMSRQLVEFAETLVGHMRAGLAKTNVVAAMLLSNLSGSATADTAAIGSVLIPTMKERGYKAGFTAALTACSGTMGPVIPPSLTFIIYGSMTGVSIAGLFLAGILPGILIGIGLIICVHILSYTKRYPEMTRLAPKASWADVGRATIRVWAAILMPIIILGGILGGVFTATESGVVACFYAGFIGLVVDRTITVRQLPAIFLEAALISATVLGILGVAGAFGWLLSYNNFASDVIASLTSVSSNGHVVFALLLLLMLFLTMFVESLAVLVVLIPVAMAITTTFNFDPYHVGVVMVVATQIGSITPPVAVLLYVATGIAKTPFEETVRHCWPLLGTLLIVLAILFAAPIISYAVPRYVFG